MNKPVSFDIAKLLASKEVDIECSKFYTKPNSTMFGIDERGRAYPIKNTPKTLYTIGEHATLNMKNVYLAPTIADVLMWLYEKYDIWIDVTLNQFSKPKVLEWMYSIVFTKACTYSHSPKAYNSPTEAYEAVIEYVLTKLI